MGNNLDSILIKTKDGQMKTVRLGVAKSVQPSATFFKNGNNNLDGLAKNGNFLPKKDEPIKNQKEIKDIKGNIKKIEKIETKQKKESILEPIAPETTTSDFYFNLEDEQEVAKFRNKEQVDKKKKHQTNLEYLIEQVIQQTDLNLPDNLIARFRRIIDSRFREIRDLRETKEVLVRSKDSSGLGLEKEQAQVILKLIEKYRIKIGEDLSGHLQTDLSQVKHSQDYKKEKQVTDIKSNITEKIKPISSFIHPSYKIEEKRVPGRVKPVSEGVIKPSQPVFEARPKYKEPVFQKTQPFKFEHKVMGPVEELASFDLESFRALAPDTQQILEKIKHKIDLLEDESFVKRAQGIQAWQSSEVYQNYLQLGQESMLRSQPVQEVIKERQSQNQPSLSFEEFEAMADLNEELSY